MTSSKYLYINSRDEFFRINIAGIVYFESDGNYTNIYLTNNLKSTICMNLSKMQEIINQTLKEEAKTFARVGKRHIINLKYVYQIAILRQKLLMTDGQNFEYTLSLSKEALKSLRDFYIATLKSKS